MATEVENMTDVVDKDVFTSNGSYCGQVRDIELDLPKFKVRALVVDAAQGSYLAQKVGGKKGVIVPFSMVNAIDDVVMIDHFEGDVRATEEEVEEEEGEERYEKEQVEETQL
ncbi:MAG: PRC-barrel domain-containing protein [Candidatus Nanohaloarchaeota archaeon QJJ-7]|nr:PRC-barrel domain-containing protein [Candidatus Nanohaloarchaeota archaeon QJJ-7]